MKNTGLRYRTKIMAESKKPSWSLYYSDNSLYPSHFMSPSPPPPQYQCWSQGTFTYKHSKKNIELTVGKFLNFTHTIQEYLRFNVFAKIL